MLLYSLSARISTLNNFRSQMHRITVEVYGRWVALWMITYLCLMKHNQPCVCLCAYICREILVQQATTPTNSMYAKLLHNYQTIRYLITLINERPVPTCPYQLFQHLLCWPECKTCKYIVVSSEGDITCQEKTGNELSFNQTVPPFVLFASYCCVFSSSCCHERW